jgi:hypothetical protein
MRLKHDYFIIECLNDDDIHDGKVFYAAMGSFEKYDPIYKEVKTKAAFEKALIEFSNSDFAYLFVSAHGNEFAIDLTDSRFEDFDLEDLEIDLKNRRIFMSTCKGGSYFLAKHFIKKGAYSVIGSPNEIDQIVATGMWPTMACVFERLNEYSLNFYELNKTLKLMTKVYQINLAYYSFIRNESKMKEYLYSPDIKRKRTDYLI